MREALFIKKNKERWDNISKRPSNNPDEMALEFTQLVDDLGYAKTFYPHSKITRFLNTEASKRYLSIYRNRREDQNRFAKLFKYDIPLAIVKHHLTLLICLILFLLFYAVGFFSAMKDEHFVREIMGDEYVNETMRNIAKGKPFDVYKGDSSFLMWLGIMVNNIKVSFLYFFEGIIPFIFTGYSLITTAIEVGAFDYMFYAKGLGGQFVLTVMIHGTLELSAIVVAVAAGIILGKSWLFPGTNNRMDALKTGAKEGAKIIIGLIPVFVTAAFFEGFVTRHYGMPLWLNISILAGSLFFVVGYFVLYPIKVYNWVKKEVLLPHG